MQTSLFQKASAEFLGTLILVLMGCGSAAISGFAGIGIVGISLAFGLSVVAMAYAIGFISGCHINPAISIGMVVAGRMKLSEALVYIVAQILGAIAGAALLLFILKGKEGGYDVAISGLGQNGYDAASPSHYNMVSGFVAEIVFTFIFLLVIFGSTSSKNINGGFAGLAIGLSLVLIHIVAIPITGVSVNPARSIGPALLVGGVALSQVWLFIVAPFIGAILSGFVWRYLFERK